MHIEYNSYFIGGACLSPTVQGTPICSTPHSAVEYSRRCNEQCFGITRTDVPLSQWRELEKLGQRRRTWVAGRQHADKCGKYAQTWGKSRNECPESFLPAAWRENVTQRGGNPGEKLAWRSVSKGVGRGSHRALRAVHIQISCFLRISKTLCTQFVFFLQNFENIILHFVCFFLHIHNYVN